MDAGRVRAGCCALRGRPTAGPRQPVGCRPYRDACRRRSSTSSGQCVLAADHGLLHGLPWGRKSDPHWRNLRFFGDASSSQEAGWPALLAAACYGRRVHLQDLFWHGQGRGPPANVLIAGPPGRGAGRGGSGRRAMLDVPGQHPFPPRGSHLQQQGRQPLQNSVPAQRRLLSPLSRPVKTVPALGATPSTSRADGVDQCRA